MRSGVTIAVLLLLLLPGTVSALDLYDVYVSNISAVKNGWMYIDFVDGDGQSVYQGAQIYYSSTSDALVEMAYTTLEGNKKISQVSMNTPPEINWIRLEPQVNNTFQYFLVGLAGILCGAFYVYAILSNMK